MLRITRKPSREPFTQETKKLSLGVADLVYEGGSSRRVLSIDIERKPMLVESWGLFDQNHSIGQIREPSGMISYAAVWEGEESNPFFRSIYHDGKERMLRGVWTLLDDADVVIGWNSKAFDIKHINTEFSLIGLGEPSPYKQIDLLQVCRRKFKHDSNKLDWISQRYFKGKKLDYGQSHSDLLRGCEAGDMEAMRALKEYNIQDVLLPLGIYKEWKEMGWL